MEEDEFYGSRKRKRGGGDGAYMGLDEDEESDFEATRPRESRQRSLRFGSGDNAGRRSTRPSTRANSHLASSEEPTPAGKPRLRPRPEKINPSISFNASQDDDRDPLQDSGPEDGDAYIPVIQSDIVKTRGRKKKIRKFSLKLNGSNRGHDVSSDIEFETRRSSRANKNSKNMTIDYAEDDDIYYVDEEKTPGLPKIHGIRETFQSPDSVEFKEAHRPVCDTCGLSDTHHKGVMIYCQGCSNVYHRTCIGPRSTREQLVTKVGTDSFVLQCRFCLCNHKKKDRRAPSQDMCFGCNMKGRACAPFSQRKTPKQEEKLRLENDGVDPITPVAPNLINNKENVMFRCSRCHRGCHFEHLPHPNGLSDPAINDPLNLRRHRRDEYSITWLCKTCQDTEDENIDKLVAWRPTNRASYTKGQSILDFTEDEVEYLIKWQDKSYAHCVWMPGAWLFGVGKSTMRLSFIKRTFGEDADEDATTDEASKDSLLRWTEKDAVLDPWLTPDIILDVNFSPRSRDQEQKYKHMSPAEKMEADKHRIYNVIKIYVKFEGLGYEDAVWDTPPSPDSGAIWDAYLDAYHEYLIGRHFKPQSHRNMTERINHFREMEFNSDIRVEEQPKGLTRGTLMGYQLEGLNWMLYNFRHERNVILADEMGLGKTVQVVALLSSFIQDSPKIWPFLIVVPNATCANWRREIKKWAPDLRVVAYYGGKVSQTLALRYELFPNNSKELKAHVVIMSYDSAKDSETKYRFNSVKWAGMVIDEAQALKNDENGLYRALSPIRVPFKLLLTGTPLQNNKRELFNLLQFVDPALKADKLDEKFGDITKENLPELHELIRPYFLRRTKAQVLTFLPPMAQIILPVSMTILQEKLCKSIMERNPQLIRSMFTRDKLKVNERGSLSNILMQLRKCLCHPFVYSLAIEDRNAPPEIMRRNLVEASSKLMLLEVMLPKLKAKGHRVLMFSQFLDELTILEDFLTGMDLRFARLDGNQSSLEKQKRIDAFNAPNSNLFIMLLSTRAGGVGINLATADTVIILDPDWNPHQDIQALSRAHRIGQKKKVLCFQLMTVDSAEEKIMQIGRKKMALDHLLIETMDEKDHEAGQDVESVLKHGAAALFGEGEKKDRIVYDGAAVDKLLDRSEEEETKLDEGGSAESAFAFARVWAQDKGTLTEEMQENEDPTISLSVWDKILQQRQEEARREEDKERQNLGRGGRRRRAADYTGQKFDFEEPLDGASDQGSGDEDFMGGEESDGSSDDAGEGKLSVNGSNRKSQGRMSQGTKNAIPYKLSRGGKVAGSPVTPKGKGKRTSTTSSRTTSSRKGQTPKTPRIQKTPATPTKTPRNRTASRPNSSASTPGSKPRARPRKTPESKSLPRSQAQRPQQQPANSNSEHANQVPPPSAPSLPPAPPLSGSPKNQQVNPENCGAAAIPAQPPQPPSNLPDPA
ncbi:PHD/FYVE-zinc-finger like domain-containing protein [Apodospora peruviana]|uniref:PHD/FYVE-zinc-finger like domain-containing protein n=1 Tax=Apodospora peruviana TaxID=516989 RepID=A0AAE0IIK8_9PEZI|nr:PHD/FYVE-zinc-finger like domain-containing protein [Apodospora peruviana]